MRIGIQTWGSDGDVYPFVALAGGLAAAGHQVTLAVTGGERKSYDAHGERLGFGVRAVGYIGRDEEDLNRTALELFATANPVRQMRLLFERMFDPGVEEIFAASRELCAASDLVVAHFILHPLRAAAEIAGTPIATVALNPGGIPSPHVPPFPAPDLGRWVNLLSWGVAGRLLDRIILPSVNRLRRRVGLAPQRSYRESWESPRCSLVGVSPTLFPPPPDWTGRHEVCGFLRPPAGPEPDRVPPELEHFLDAGPPPVYLTFGSMVTNVVSGAFVADATRLLVGAARAAGCRAIVQSRWELAGDVARGEDIFPLESAPHLAVFPHCAAVVHHGGAGTTQSATLSGRLSVVVPHVLDQYFWGGVLHRLGAAPRAIDRRRATPESLGRAIRAAVGSRAMGERARELGALMAAEDGVGAAVRAIEAEFAASAPRSARRCPGVG